MIRPMAILYRVRARSSVRVRGAIRRSAMCLKPIPAWYVRGKKSKNGKRVLSFTPPMVAPVGSLVSGTATVPDLMLPCGKCILCRDNIRKEWIKRLRLELFSNPAATFVTLTYDEESCPVGVEKKDVQRFIKRFRHLKRDYGIDIPKFKYFVCSEYGSTTYRPHYHAIIFGIDMMRCSAFAPYVATVKIEGNRRYPVYSSPVLEKVWSNGFVSIDFVTPSTVRYVAKYLLKCDNDFDCDRFYPNFHLYSRGIGTGLFLRGDDSMTDFAYSTFKRGRLLIDRDGYEECAPRFLDRYFDIRDSDFRDDVKRIRREYVLHRPFDLDSAKARAEFIKLTRAKSKQKEVLK